METKRINREQSFKPLQQEDPDEVKDKSLEKSFY